MQSESLIERKREMREKEKDKREKRRVRHTCRERVLQRETYKKKTALHLCV